jgi:hypothetical protein
MAGPRELLWLVGAHDRWHQPAEETSTRRRRLGAAPAFETTVRVPSGEVAQRAYGVAAPTGCRRGLRGGEPVAGSLTVGFVARFDRRAHIEVDGAVVRVHGRPVIALSALPRRWAVGDSTAATFIAGDARSGPVAAFEAPGELALLFPAAHRTRVRAVLGDVAGVVPRDLPDADAVARRMGCAARSRAPSRAPAADRRDRRRSRAPTCCSHHPTTRPWGALEDWGFDAEAAGRMVGAGLAGAAPGAPARSVDDPWRALRGVDAVASRRLASCRRCVAVLVREHGTQVDLLPGFPPDWLGQSLTVSDLPCAPDRCRSRCAGTAPVPRCCGTRRRASRCARRRSIPRGRPAIASARRCSPSRPGRCCSFAAGQPSRRRGHRRARAVLVTDEHDDLDDFDDFDDDSSRRALRSGAANAAAVSRSLRYLVDEIGASLPELVAAQEEGRADELRRGADAAAGRRALDAVGHRRSRRHRAGVRRRDLARPRVLADVRPFERRFGASDTVVFELVRDLAAMVGREHGLQLVRTAGEAVARIAEAEIALLRSNVEAPLAAEGHFEDVARTYAARRESAGAARHQLIDTFHRHHLEVIAHRYSAVNAPTSTANVVELAVGFADIAGLHRPVAQARSAPELATMLARFEATTGDVIAASGANVAQADRRRGHVRQQRAGCRVCAGPRTDRGVRARAASRSCGSASRPVR